MEIFKIVEEVQNFEKCVVEQGFLLRIEVLKEGIRFWKNLQ